MMELDFWKQLLCDQGPHSGQYYVEIRGYLTVEQREKLAKLIEES